MEVQSDYSDISEYSQVGADDCIRLALRILVYTISQSDSFLQSDVIKSDDVAEELGRKILDV